VGKIYFKWHHSLAKFLHRTYSQFKSTTCYKQPAV